MKVYLGGGIMSDEGLYCSTACYRKSGGRKELNATQLPATTSSPVLTLLLERATCDQCGVNLRDVSREAHRLATTEQR